MAAAGGGEERKVPSARHDGEEEELYEGTESAVSGFAEEDAQHNVANTTPTPSSASKPLPVGLKLNGYQLRFENGKWVADGFEQKKQPVQQIVYEGQDQGAWEELETRLEELEDEGNSLKSKNDALRERNSLLEIKNQILLEMLAVSQLDAQKSTEELKREKTKVEVCFDRKNIPHSFSLISI
eukprot:gb/GECG01005578.1/.p1 GENE.gb/GECG01005578.1/~~gb/GECG01005578.1/.p1  ORF type:complete len:183 (+),score=46.79 gb/GECG01005578.1/:1-549(+)